MNFKNTFIIWVFVFSRRRNIHQLFLAILILKRKSFNLQKIIKSEFGIEKKNIHVLYYVIKNLTFFLFKITSTYSCFK